MSTPTKVWFVTGASSGLGLAVTQHILALGDRVVATLRKPEAIEALSNRYPESQLLVLKLDVTKLGDITRAFAKSHEKFGQIGVVYNNAGFCVLGEIENAPDDVVRSMFEVNFWGSTNVAREAIKYFREFNKPSGGRLLQVSSMAGVHGMAGLGYYSATKYAVEGISESLSKELNPAWNIKVNIIALGSYATRAIKPESMIETPEHPAYNNGVTSGVRKFFTDPNLQLPDPEIAAKNIYNIAQDPKAPLHVALGVDAIAVVNNQLEALRSDLGESKKWSV